MKALASCNLSYSIINPLKVLTKLVGSYNSAFSDEGIDLFIKQVLLAPIREAISMEISTLDIIEYNSKLSHIGNMATSTISSNLSEYGIKLERFELVAINIPDSEIRRLYSLEQEYAGGKTRTDLELDHLQRVWNGNVNNRMLSEMMTGIPSRGQIASSGATGGTSRNTDGIAPMMMQVMMLSQMLPSFRESLDEVTQRADMFGSSSSGVRGTASSAETPPPIPDRYKRCPSCSGNVIRNNNICPNCGYRFNERND